MSRYFARRTETVQENLTEATPWLTAEQRESSRSSGSGEGDGHQPDAILDDFGFTRWNERFLSAGSDETDRIITAGVPGS